MLCIDVVVGERKVILAQSAVGIETFAKALDLGKQVPQPHIIAPRKSNRSNSISTKHWSPKLPVNPIAINNIHLQISLIFTKMPGHLINILLFLWISSLF